MERSRPKKKKRERSLARSFVVTVAVGVPGALLAGTGCSSTAGAPQSSAISGQAPQGPGVRTGKCTDEGAQQPCHFSLGQAADGKAISCFQGTQTCTGGTWSSCGGEGTVASSVEDLELVPASAGGVHTLAVKGCGDNVCAGPQCQGGVNDKDLCSIAGCAGGICVVGICNKGSKNGQACVVAADCPGGTCVPQGETCSSCPGDCGVCPPGAPSTGLPVCTTDPCDPDCQGWTNAPGITSGGGLGIPVVGVSGFGQIPNGQISKLLLDGCNAGTTCDKFGSYGLPSSYYNCQMDTQCAMTALGGDGCCHQFDPLEVLGTDTSSMGANAGIDLTIGPGCSDIEKDKYRYFPICNRGAVPVPAGQVIRVKYNNPNAAFAPCDAPGKGIQSCTAAAGFDCSMKVAVGGLLPGTCQLLDTQNPTGAPGGGACSQPNGDKWIFVNCDGAVVEGNITMKPGGAPVGVTGAPDNEPTAVPGILGCANNWTDHSPNNNPPACTVAGPNVVTFTADYHASCPTGTGPVWNKLIYDTATPKNASGTSEVFFEAATAPDVAGAPGAFSPYIELAEAQATPAAPNAGKPYVVGGVTLGADPEKCSATLPAVPPYTWTTCTNAGPGPSPPCCPKDIEDQFARTPVQTPFEGVGPAAAVTLARQPWLRLKITLKATPDSKADATLNNWSVSYLCVARE